MVTAAQNVLPRGTPGVPPLGARVANLLLACVAVVVAFVGHVERLLGGGTGGLPVHDVREATLSEVTHGAGALSDKRLLPSAYEVWIGPRADGHLRLRYTFDAPRLRAMLPSAQRETCACTPLALDAETVRWVREHVTQPCPTSRLYVWRALKRRLYHYDAGVVAFRGFPRNFLLSSSQWRELLSRTPTRGRDASVALDIGAGDGSLNEPMRDLFGRLVVTELTTPLVMRLRSLGLDGVLAEEPLPQYLGRSSFDAVLILNVLDRCKDPFEMLAQARALLPVGGQLVVSVVLPASQSDAAVSVGSAQRRWEVAGRDFESAAAALVANVLVPAGFEPQRVVRAPYFCAGDRYSPVAALDACVLVLTKRADGPTSGAAHAEPTPCEPCE